MTTQFFTFQNHTLEAVQYEGKYWFTAATLAKALEYSRGDKITQIYNRNADEFTPCMSINVKLTFNDVDEKSGNLNLRLSRKSKGYNNLVRSVRVFSLRGAHLIAMFANTPVAKDFRKWVLDLLDRETSQVKQPTIVVAPHRECLPKMVYHRKSKYNPYSAWASNNDKNVYVGCFPTVEEAVAAQHRYFEEGEIKRINKAKQNEYPVDKTDFVNHLKTILEAAQLLSCYEYGKELAWDLVAFSQEEAQRFNQPA